MTYKLIDCSIHSLLNASYHASEVINIGYESLFTGLPSPQNEPKGWLGYEEEFASQQTTIYPHP